jgi:hypothetical protein
MRKFRARKAASPPSKTEPPPLSTPDALFVTREEYAEALELILAEEKAFKR